LLLVAALTAASYLAPAAAQPRGPGGPPRTARQAAPVDLTGQWVSIVTEDWRFRMVTPPKGDLPGVNLTPAGAAIANAWDPAKDAAAGEQCGFGAGDHAHPQPDQMTEGRPDAADRGRRGPANAYASRVADAGRACRAPRAKWIPYAAAGQPPAAAQSKS
jgi:hypothetical protein